MPGLPGNGRSPGHSSGIGQFADQFGYDVGVKQYPMNRHGFDFVAIGPKAGMDKGAPEHRFHPWTSSLPCPSRVPTHRSRSACNMAATGVTTSGDATSSTLAIQSSSGSSGSGTGSARSTSGPSPNCHRGHNPVAHRVPTASRPSVHAICPLPEPVSGTWRQVRVVLDAIALQVTTRAAPLTGSLTER